MKSRENITIEIKSTTTTKISIEFSPKKVNEAVRQTVKRKVERYKLYLITLLLVALINTAGYVFAAIINYRAIVEQNYGQSQVEDVHETVITK